MRHDVEYITGVVIKYQDSFWALARPNRHEHVEKLLPKTALGGNFEKGFMTSTGRFVNRRDAMIIAKAAAQLIHHRLHGDEFELQSPHVW